MAPQDMPIKVLPTPYKKPINCDNNAGSLKGNIYSCEKNMNEL